MKYNDIVVLKDKQSCQEAMKSDINADGLKLTVEESKLLVARTDKDITFEITSFQKSELYLIQRLVKGVESLAQYGVFFRPDGFKSGTRQEILGSGAEWLFNPPANPDKYNPDDLSFADTIYNDDFQFNKIGDIGGNGWLITEWQCDDNSCPNNRLLVLEEKNVVFFFQGILINEFDFEIFGRRSTVGV